MTARAPTVDGMKIARRMELGMVLVLLAAGLGIAGAGAIAGLVGAELPERLGMALGVAGMALGWVKVAVAAALVVGVARAREDG